jgi:hypothetical protein
VSYLFYRFLQEKGMWQEGLYAYVLHEGTPGAPRVEEIPEEEHVLQMSRIICHDKSDSAKLSRSASRLFDLDTFEKKKDWGRKMYDAISRLRHEGEMDKVLRLLVSEGVLDKPESAVMKAQLQHLIAHPQLQSLFKEGLRVDLSREILLKNRELLKPDRVVWQGSRLTILDYKTGSPELWHREPMEKYRELFGKMGFQQITTWLVYLEEAKVMEV